MSDPVKFLLEVSMPTLDDIALQRERQVMQEQLYYFKTPADRDVGCYRIARAFPLAKFKQYQLVPDDAES